jgi:hypothetical protein
VPGGFGTGPPALNGFYWHLTPNAGAPNLKLQWQNFGTSERSPFVGRAKSGTPLGGPLANKAAEQEEANGKSWCEADCIRRQPTGSIYYPMFFP